MKNKITTISPRAEFLLSVIKDSYHVLKSETDLSPANDRINVTLNRLVSSVVESFYRVDDHQVLENPYFKDIKPKLLEKLSEAESEMELYWADSFCQIDSLNLENLKNFWYWDNYSKLVDGELSSLPKVKLSQQQSIAFVGSGPLPLSAIIMHLKTGHNVTCVDNDKSAVIKSKELVRKLGLEAKINIVHAQGENFDYKNTPIVFVASLVPMKDKVVQQVSNTGRNNILALRSAEKIHSILYEPVDKQASVLQKFNYAGKTRIDPNVINTTLFYKPKHNLLSHEKSNVKVRRLP